MSLYLYGASGHGKVVLEIAEELGINVQAFIDQDSSKEKCLDYSVIDEVPIDAELVLSLGNNLTRKRIAKKYIQHQFITLVHPKAIISKRVMIAEGTVVMAGVLINSCSKIGKHCIINTGAVIDHDCIIGDFAHISPNASLAGNVEVGEASQVGIGASVIQGIKIGKNCLIGAGAVVVKDIPDNAVVVGNPARIIKFNN